MEKLAGDLAPFSAGGHVGQSEFPSHRRSGADGRRFGCHVSVITDRQPFGT